jgi:ABC-type transport system substrate-binding protein
VAIKLIAPSILTPETEQRFQAEAQVVAQMDHPSIVSIYDFGRHEGSLFFVMPVVKGTSLRQLIRDQALLLGDIIDVGIGVAEALDYSQQRGIVHRDIKPENAMVSREGGALRVRVMDFGLARSSDVTRLTKTGMMVGTMSYVSPEQVTGKPTDTRSDLYSLGNILYECVTGDVPFAGEMQSVLYRVVHEFPQPPRERGADIDEELEEIILSCLAKDPDKRPQKAADLAHSLRRYRSRLRDSEREKSVMVTRTLHAQRPAQAPFVDREEEYKELQQRLNAAVAGECQLVILAGEAGIGKTRLLDELENLAAARQIRVLHGRFVEQDGAFPYHGYCEAIQEYFRQKELGTTSSAPPDFSDLGDDLIALFPMLSEIEAISSTSGASSPAAGVGEARLPENRTQIFELLARTLTRLAEGKPLVLLFEELHGAEVSIEALQYIVRRLGPTPTLIVGTYRPTEIDRSHALTQMLDGLRGDRRFAQITLGPFTPAHHREFLSTLIGGATFDDELARRLFDSTEGNPFFTKELIRSLLDAGSIVQDKSGSWALSGGIDISSDALPATIQQAVEKRIGRLPEELRDVLSIAAVMGKTFDFRDLEKLARDADDLDDIVDRLIQEGLIEEERQSRGDTLVFSSGVVREVLYAEVSRRKRRTLHRRYAAHLEKRHAGKLERIYPRLVYHYSEGDEPEKTVEYGLLHAEKSLDAFSPEEAIRSVKTALDFLDEEWEGDPDAEGQARALLARGLQMSGDIDGALKEIAAAVKIYEREKRADRVVHALLGAARIAWQARRPSESRQWVERGLEAARAAGETEKLGEFLSLAATLANLRGEYAKASDYQQEAEKLEQKVRETEAVQEIPRGGKLVVALANPVVADEPATMQFVEEWEVLSNVYETLLTTDAAGGLTPALCEKWEATDEGSAFFFHLRSGICFEDGQPLTAQAVKSAFERSIRQSASNLAPAFGPIRGVEAYLQKQADEVEGLKAQGEYQLVIRLEERLPIYPSLLTDARLTIFREAAGNPGGNGPALVGTGPFRLASRDARRIALERNPDYWQGTPPNIESIEFWHDLSSADIAASRRSGEVDVGGDLLPKDLEVILRDPRFRGGLAEAAKSSTYYVLFNTRSEAVANAAVRRALSEVIRAQDLVWQTLGRFAQPAVGLLPPSMLGHDPGRRRPSISLDEARELLQAAGISGTLELTAAVHPILQDRHAALLKALFSVWSEIGVNISIKTPDMAAFMETWQAEPGVDLGIMRWAADYNDPDNFTHNLFHSETGQLRGYFSSPESDQLFSQARTETQPSVRQGLYGKFESQLIQGSVLIPLFHDVDYRVANRKVRNLKVRSAYPAVNYTELGKAETVAPEAEGPRRGGGTVHIPVATQVHSLDPAQGNRLEEAEAVAGIYETLTRFSGARIEPWLAKSFSTEESGRVYRFSLRDDVRFHDGRRLTARDVRHSFERLLQNEDSDRRGQFAPIRGAQDLLEGRSSELIGFHIHSSREFTIELEQPVVFFPFLISDAVASIVPEGTGKIGNRLEEGAVGTGPFRVVSFKPGELLETERNPTYWHTGYPRCEGMVIHFGIDPEEIMAGFREGRFSLAGDLHPPDVEALRRDSLFAAGYREAPSLSTYYAVFNIHRGPLADLAARRRVVDAMDVPRQVRQTMGTRAIPATGWIPPSLLGYDAGQEVTTISKTARPGQHSDEKLELSAAVHPVFMGEHVAFYELLLSTLAEKGIHVKNVTKTVSEYIKASQLAEVDLEIGRWYADYPDADAFAHCLQSKEGALGQMCGTSELDQLIQAGRQDTDPHSRHTIYRQIEDAVAREALMRPLFHEQVYRFVHPDVEGLTVSDWQPIVSYSTLRVRGE